MNIMKYFFLNIKYYQINFVFINCREIIINFGFQANYTLIAIINFNFLINYTGFLVNHILIIIINC